MRARCAKADPHEMDFTEWARFTNLWEPMLEPTVFPTVIQIPFHEDMKWASINGLKNVTGRNDKYAEVGDYFAINPETNTPLMKGPYWYKVIHVEQMPLNYVASCLYRMEGFTEPAHFVRKWNEIHPKKTFESDPNHKVWEHFYIPLQRFLR